MIVIAKDVLVVSQLVGIGRGANPLLQQCKPLENSDIISDTARRTLAAASAAPHLKSRRKEESNPESVGVDLIQVTTLKTVESTEERVVRFATPEPQDTVNGNADADETKLVEERELSTEVNGTESSGGNSTGGESDNSTGDESGDDYDDEDPILVKRQ
ncbi:hypothetical protein RchiOBHm_Chr4g0436101 [Rosa chinensis]|uniref:Uncharacterized protein n=1 Tax=Rosa chinensis TaxID=74649 RepID=A0A2P6R1Z0_ROSCH|nr:hypothetical protein RchiOBHm_Chr4g0436101 [Rosa chinensis]